MATSSKKLRICSNGHRYFKSSDCPTCPICEEERKPADGFLTNLSAPARRALENNHISTLQQLAQFSEKEILRFHGIGKSSIPKLKNTLAELHLTFKDNTDE